MLTYEILRLIWWVLLGVLLCGFAIMDGFDLGVAALLPFVAKNDTERRVVINTIGPVWEGNQVWFILGGGAIFAAWPYVYAVSFSGFYLAMFLILCALIIRPVGFKFRSKINHSRWAQFWDISLFCAGLIPALVFGIAVGNTLQGVPFGFDETLRMTYQGSFWALLNPFALLCGLVSLAMLLMHGGLYLRIKTEGAIQERATQAARSFGLATLVLFALAGIWVMQLEGYSVIGTLNHDAPSNPLHKEVAKLAGGWLVNYAHYPWTRLAPALGLLGAAFATILARRGQGKLAFFSSSLSITGIIATVGVSMFPFILPSSSHPNASLLVWDASSSRLTLQIMLLVTAIFLPIIVLYTSWVYRVLRGKVTEAYVKQYSHDLY